MAYPVRSVLVPQVLVGTENGKLPARILTATPGQAGGATVTLCQPAARAWRALCADARKHGHTLKTNAPSSSYRTYAEQERIFRERYTRTYLAGRPYKLWDSNGDGIKERWYQRPGTAVAAVPGQSNHGRALAVDAGEERDGDTGAEPFDDPTLDWLVANEQRFGFSHEIQSEPWHIRYFAGDAIPRAVLDYEASLKPDPDPAPEPTPTPTTEAPGVITYFYVRSVKKYFCIRGAPLSPTKIELTTDEGFTLASDNPGLFIEVRTATLFNKMIKDYA